MVRSSPITPLAGRGIKSKKRKYRSMRRKMRATYTSTRNYAADMMGVKRPPVRQRRKYKIWRV